MEQNEKQLGDAIRSEFPIFAGPPDAPRRSRLAYLDTAASSQKPRSVIDRVAHFLAYEHANVRRGAYALSARASELFEGVRTKVARFVGAESGRSIIFCKGTTEGINLVAHSLEHLFSTGDAVLSTVLEHHSNIVPWQLLAERRGAQLEFVDCDDHATLRLDDLEAKLARHHPKLVAVTHVANSIGSITPVREVISLAHRYGARVLLDAAQSAAHMPLDVSALDVDFLVFSGHKLYGPTGVGVLYCRPDNYAVMKPFLGGGDMIERVTLQGSTWAEPPQRFEAGTPPIAEVIGLGVAIDFIEEIGIPHINAFEHRLFDFGYDILAREPGVTVYGPRTVGGAQSSIIAFTVTGVHAHDLASIADARGVQLRAGHHCAMPALHRLGLPATARVSLGVYNDEADFHLLIEAIREARSIFH